MVQTAKRWSGRQVEISDGRNRGKGGYPPSVQASLLLIF